MMEIAEKLGHKHSSIAHWMKRASIPRRQRSEAAYVKKNPGGDPFQIKQNLTLGEHKLLGLGLGLYWGEGNKKNKTSVRLGNTDPELITEFRRFLIEICGVRREKIKYDLLIFNDSNPKEAVKFWSNKLAVPKTNFGAVTILKPRGKGTYRSKNMTGVLMISVHNKRLKEWFDKMVKNL